MALEAFENETFCFRIQISGFYVELIHENSPNTIFQENTLPYKAQLMATWPKIL